MPVVEGKFRAYKGECPDESRHAEALKRLGEGAAERVLEVADPPADLASALEGLEALLTEIPTSVALESLAADQGRQAWAERGMHLVRGSACGSGGRASGALVALGRLESQFSKRHQWWRRRSESASPGPGR